jgi:hypothetical protein
MARRLPPRPRIRARARLPRQARDGAVSRSGAGTVVAPARREVVHLHELRRPGLGDSSPSLGEREYRDVLLRSMMRAQLGLTLGFIALAVCVLGSLPLIAALIPSLSYRHVFGVPVSLAVLGFGVYPVLIGLGFGYVRLAERTERRFLELVDRL